MLRTIVFPVTLAALTAACAPQAPREDAFTASGQVIAFGGGNGGAAMACVNCHGLRGEGDGKSSPRLAGLDRGYIHRQLDDYVAGRRDHVTMRAVALRLSGQARAKVSAYYAGLDPMPAPEGPSDPAGATLYRRGDPVRGLDPCAICHGANGEGAGPGNPPLAGQPAAYLAGQLTAWREGRRQNDPLGQMREISRRLSAGEIDAVSRYAAGLSGLRHPAAPAACPAARRDDPRNDASGPLPHGSGS
jgi:cytochrome c553